MKEEQEVSFSRSGLKIAVFGAGGAVGSILTGFIQQLECVSQITCVDRNLERTYEFVKNREKIIHIVTNGQPEKKLIRALKNHFLIINAASSLLNRKIMKIAWGEGANYLDFASFKNDEAEQKNFHQRFQEKSIVGWINWGVGPGLTNLLAAKLIKGLRDCVVKIRVAEMTKLAKKENGQETLIFLWNPQLIIDEITSPVYAFSKDPRRAGIIREPFSGPEFCVFPYPIGKITCRCMNENEGITLKNLPNVREADVKSGGDDIERLYKLFPKVRKLQEKKQLPKFLDQLKTPSPAEIKKLIDDEILLDGRIAIMVEVDGEDPKTEERVLHKATWMGLSLREVPRGTTHLNYNTSVVAMCAIQQMIKTRLEPGVWAPEDIPELNREQILQCVQNKTNPIHI